MSRKVLQIGYEPEKDRLTWDDWDIHCGQGLDVLLPDQHGGAAWRRCPLSTIPADGICLDNRGCLQSACGARESREGT